MSRLLEWNTLQEAADYLTGELGKNWTPRMVLDAGEKESFKVRFVLPHGTTAWAGHTEEWVGDKAELIPNSIDQLLSHGTVRVGWVPFTNPKTNRETMVALKPPPQISFDEIRIRSSELETFAVKGASAAAKVGAVTTITPAPAAPPSDAGLSKRERQIRTIEAESDLLGYERQQIATGCKTTLRNICKEKNPLLFGAGNDPFNDAWNDAIHSSPPRLRMAEHNKFAGE